MILITWNFQNQLQPMAYSPCPETTARQKGGGSILEFAFKSGNCRMGPVQEILTTATHRPFDQSEFRFKIKKWLSVY